MKGLDRMGVEDGRVATANRNREAVISYLEKGAKGVPLRGDVGVEIEHFIVDSADGSPVGYRDAPDRLGIEGILKRLSEFYPRVGTTSQGAIIGCANDDAALTIEPAAQLEISIAPFREIADVASAYAAFRERLAGILAGNGYEVVSQGYHPTAKARDMALIPKDRYRFMDEHFSQLGLHGDRMMRASASTQVSVDYADEADAVRKMRIASALSPILADIADNAPVYEGKPNTGRLARLRLWREVDPQRCGIVPGTFDPGFGFSAYVDWLFAHTPIFVTRPEPGRREPSVRGVGHSTARDAYADAPMSERDVEHLLSMFWPDVRLKRYVEIRPADSLPTELLLGYTALVKGIFYNEGALSRIEAGLRVENTRWTLREDDVEAAIRAIAAEGDSAAVYGSGLAEWKSLLFEEAASGLIEEEVPYLRPLAARSLRA